MEQSQQSKPQLPRFNWTWWIVLIVLGIWNLLAFWPRGTPEVEIPYSAFVSQVRSDNVDTVEIAGDGITGTFVQAISWPVATPGPTAAGAQSSESPPPEDYSAFNTTFPESVGDPNLMSLLEQHRVEVNVVQPPTPWFTILLTDGLPIIMLLLVVVWMGRQASRGAGGILGFGRSKPQVTVGDRPDVTFDDVAGADEAKRGLQEVVDFLRHPEKYHELGARIPKGVLLVGHPGTGKTLLARAVAGEADVPFFSISASEFVEMFVGVGASRVRDLFDQAKIAAPAIVFIDELDAVGRRRGSGLGAVNDEREQTLNQLLVEMDGFDERHEVILLAATNRPDVLDPALLRPGRFDREIVVNLPDRRGREGILQIHTRQLQLAPDVNLGELARATSGLSGADLANLCNEAALTAARNNHKQIMMQDFEEAQDRVVLGEARSLFLEERDRRIIAYHEAGHAVVAWCLPEADPVHKVTIIPRGRALGVTEQLPGEDRYNYSRAYLLARLAVMLGGRTAEEIAIGEITTGAENDLIEATSLARRMVTRWGMSDAGLAAFKADDEQPFLGYELAQGRDYSEATAARIDAEVQRILTDRHAAARDLLTQHRDKLDQLADALLHKETVEDEDLVAILGEHPQASSE
jgi:cell division protease FtsH